MQSLVLQYLAHKRTWYSQGTCRNDTRALRHFRRITQIHSVTDLSPESIALYVRERSKERGKGGQKVSPSTINVEIRCLKAFSKWLLDNGCLDQNPFENVRQLRVPPPTSPPFLDLDQVEALLRGLTKTIYPIVLCGLKTGIRKLELFNLKWEDIDQKRNLLRVVAWDRASGHNNKTYSERWIPFDDELASVFEGLPRRSDYIFPNKDGFRRCETSNTINREIGRMAKRAGIKSKVTLKVLRHSYASHLRMSGVDLETVGKLMGHKERKTTKIYEHLTPNFLRAEAEKLPIRAPLNGKISSKLDRPEFREYLPPKMRENGKRPTVTVRMEAEEIKTIGQWIDPTLLQAQVLRALMRLGLERVLSMKGKKRQRDFILETLRQTGG